MVAEHSTILFSRNRLYHYQRTRPLTVPPPVRFANAYGGNLLKCALGCVSMLPKLAGESIIRTPRFSMCDLC